MRVIVLCAAAAASLYCATAFAQSAPPRYDAEAYCQKVAQSVGGSAQIENTCLEQEQSAYDELKANWSKMSAKAKSYCDHVSRAVGGTYQIMKTCIEQEMQSSANKQKFKY